jgi:lipoprotein-anchoring transpeptidase ErfK/SrfK
VITSSTPNGRLSWIDRRAPGLRLDRTAYSLHADLSSRALELRRGRRAVATVAVAVGAAGTPTPAGRFAVTDKLSGAGVRRVYGCCIVALSGFQPNPPPGWRDGTRLAVHGTPTSGTVGTASSAGCLRADARVMRMLMRRVPLGAPVFIKR